MTSDLQPQVQAKITALRLLAASAKSRKELETRLAQKGFTREVIQTSLDALENQGLVNDTAFAQALITRFTLGKPSGSRKIRFEMKRRGVSPQIQNELLAEETVESELERARELGRIRWDKYKALDPMRRQKRVFDFLMRRGFDYQASKTVIDELRKSHEESDD